MTRRNFLAASAVLGTSLAGSQSNAGQPVRLQLTDRRLGEIPANFVGLGYEISSVASGLLNPRNHAYIQFVRTLSRHGVIRVGGNTSDYSTYSPNAAAISAPKATIIDRANLDDLGAFLDATGWTLIWGLNLGGGNEQQAVEEAQAVSAAVKDKLLAFEIGNEPDLFGHAHRPRNYSYDAYLSEYRTYKAAIRRALPNAPFAGPDAASATDWVTRFAADEGSDLKLLTHHYYRECASPIASLDRLLHPDPKLKPELEKLQAASAASHLPFRICEVNSLCGGGKPSVSDTFGAALWALDYMFTVASAGGAGVNIETGVNHLGWISWYSPIGDDEHGNYSAKPDYYGMLAFARASKGQRLAVDYDPTTLNLSAYAVAESEKRTSVTIVNKDPGPGTKVNIACDRQIGKAEVMRLTGPSLESKQEVTLGGSTVTSNGEWQRPALEPVRANGTMCEVNIPGASAAIVTLNF